MKIKPGLHPSEVRYQHTSSISHDKSASIKRDIIKLKYVKNNNLQMHAIKNHSSKRKGVHKLPISDLSIYRTRDSIKNSFLNENLFIINNREFLFENGFDEKCIVCLAKKNVEIKSFVLKNAKHLYESGVNSWYIIRIAGEREETKRFVLKNCKFMHESNFDGWYMIYISKERKEIQDFVLKKCKSLLKLNFDEWSIINLAKEHLKIKEFVLNNCKSLCSLGFNGLDMIAIAHEHEAITKKLETFNS